MKYWDEENKKLLTDDEYAAKVADDGQVSDEQKPVKRSRK